jgi:hypothetical protein
MFFDHEPGIRRGMERERSYYQLDCASYAGKGRMQSDLRIRIELERKQEIGVARLLDPRQQTPAEGLSFAA